MTKRDLFKKKLRLLHQDNYSLQRYYNLVGRQCRIAGTPAGIAPDTAFDLREFSFYPVFLDALREKLDRSAPPVQIRGASKHDRLQLPGEKALKMLKNSEMSPSRKNFYEWHLRDALRGE